MGTKMMNKLKETLVVLDKARCDIEKIKGGMACREIDNRGTLAVLEKALSKLRDIVGNINEQYEYISDLENSIDNVFGSLDVAGNKLNKAIKAVTVALGNVDDPLDEADDALVDAIEAAKDTEKVKREQGWAK
jgi:ABC-type transporter Mla subunit MlaD